MVKTVMMPARYRGVVVGVVGCLLIIGMLGFSFTAKPVQGDTPAESVSTLAEPAAQIAEAIVLTNAEVSAIGDGEYLTLTERARGRYASLANRPKVITHTVEAGESTWSIAQRFSTDLGTIEALNPGIHPDSLSPGDTLRVVPFFSGLVHQVKSGDTIESIASAYDAPTEQLLHANVMRSEDTLNEGALVFVPGARRRAQVASRGDTSRRTAQVEVATAPAAPPAEVSPPAPAAKTKWVWPLTGGQFFSEYGWREGAFHRGLDIAAPTGTPVVAAAAGTVVTANWDGGYGYLVTIDHGNGITTKYAHASKILVSVGQSVAQGQRVILVGSTGNSTGPHVHFEILVNGSAVNPRQYLP